MIQFMSTGELGRETENGTMIRDDGGDPLARPLTPRDRRTRRALVAFLAGSRVMLLGRLDGRGEVVAANRALSRRIGGGPGASIEAALWPRSRAPWREALASDSPTRRLRLWFGPGRAER